MWQNSNSTVHNPSTEPSDTKLHGIVKQPPHLKKAEMDPSEEEEEFRPLKKSSAATRLTLESETEDEIQHDSAPFLKRRHKNNEISSDSDSFLNLGRQRSSHCSLNKRSTNARRQRIINEALANTDDSDSDDNSPEHLAYAGGVRSQATRVSHGGTKFASQGGGYGAAYAKRRDTNRKRIIKVSKPRVQLCSCPFPYNMNGLESISKCIIFYNNNQTAVFEDATVQTKGEERASWLPSKVSPFFHGPESS